MLINSFLLLDVAWAGGEVTSFVNKECLASALKLNNDQLMHNFKIICKQKLPNPENVVDSKSISSKRSQARHNLIKVAAVLMLMLSFLMIPTTLESEKKYLRKYPSDIDITKTVNDQIEGLSNEWRWNRDKAAEALSRNGDPRSRFYLYLYQRNIREAIKIDNAVELGIEALRHANGNIRYWATVLLGEIGDARAVEPLIARGKVLMANRDYDYYRLESVGDALFEIGGFKANFYAVQFKFPKTVSVFMFIISAICFMLLLIAYAFSLKETPENNGDENSRKPYPDVYPKSGYLHPVYSLLKDSGPYVWKVPQSNQLKASKIKRGDSAIDRINRSNHLVIIEKGMLATDVNLLMIISQAI